MRSSPSTSAQPLAADPLSVADLREDLRALMRRTLDDDEVVTWIGAPDARLAARAQLAPSLFGVPFTLFSCIAASQAFESGVAPGLFGASFVLVGLVLLLSPLFAWAAARRTAYVVTDRRALLFRRRTPPQTLLSSAPWVVRAYAPGRDARVQREERADDAGAVVFARVAPADRRGRTRVERAGFRFVRDATDVERRLQALPGPSDDGPA